MTSVFLIVGARAYADALTTALHAREMRVAGQAFDWTMGVPGLPHRRVVVVLDAGLADAPEVARQVTQTRPSAAILLVGIDDRTWDVGVWASAPAAGYLHTAACFDEFVDAIETVARRAPYCSPCIATALVQRLGAAPEGVSPQRLLTAREQEIARLVASGLTNKEIARRLSIALPTVKNHVHSILGKLGAQRRSQAVARLNDR